MEAIKERFEKILDRIETSGKSATEWFGKYTHELLMNPDNWWEALAVQICIRSQREPKGNSRFLPPDI